MKHVIPNTRNRLKYDDEKKIVVQGAKPVQKRGDRFRVELWNDSEPVVKWLTVPEVASLCAGASIDDAEVDLHPKSFTSSLKGFLGLDNKE